MFRNDTLGGVRSALRRLISVNSCCVSVWHSAPRLARAEYCTWRVRFLYARLTRTVLQLPVTRQHVSRRGEHCSASCSATLPNPSRNLRNQTQLSLGTYCTTADATHVSRETQRPNSSSSTPLMTRRSRPRSPPRPRLLQTPRHVVRTAPGLLGGRAAGLLLGFCSAAGGRAVPPPALCSGACRPSSAWAPCRRRAPVGRRRPVRAESAAAHVAAWLRGHAARRVFRHERHVRYARWAWRLAWLPLAGLRYSASHLLTFALSAFLCLLLSLFHSLSPCLSTSLLHSCAASATLQHCTSSSAQLGRTCHRSRRQPSVFPSTRSA
jgi:hypothetical protein